MENYPQVTPVGLFVCGGGARLTGLAAALSSELGIEVALLNALRGLGSAPGALPPDAARAAGLAACIGLARGDLECD
jgi:Tfp pilus assembly PilM family ATPase